MKLHLVLALALLVVAAACQKKEEAIQPLDEYTSSDLQASGNNFYVYAGARFLPEMTDLFKKSHFVLHPEATTAPPIAAYESDASVKDVAEFYAKKYEYPEVAPDEVNNLSSVKPHAFYRAGDMSADTKALQPILAKLNVKSDLTRATGNYNAAHISPKQDFPRVSIQRPYFDFLQSKVVDKTFIIIVKE